MNDLARFSGGKTALPAAAGLGLLGLAATALGFFTNPHDTMFSYLLAFTYWVGLAVGGLALLMIFTAARARWIVVVRRSMEIMAASMPIFLVLFIPILLGARHLFIWVSPPSGLSEEMVKLLEHKRPYLNLSWFFIRGCIYLGFWLFMSELMLRLSTRQDEEGGAPLTRRARAWATGGLPALALTLTFAGFDWLMSLSPQFFSTIFGLYYFAGSFVGAIALLIVAAASSREDRTAFGAYLSLDHFHNLGKLLLAFIAFWAYIGFSQYMLTWVANLPEEIPWALVRTRGTWRTVGIVLVFGHFVIPFFILLSRELKLKPARLALVALWVLAVHFIDLYWVVMPAAHPEGLGLHWTHLTAFVGVGGCAVACALYRLRGRYAIPVGDPYLEDSLRYVQP